jgi:hypothetical protein
MSASMWFSLLAMVVIAPQLSPERSRWFSLTYIGLALASMLWEGLA